VIEHRKDGNNLQSCNLYTQYFILFAIKLPLYCYIVTW